MLLKTVFILLAVFLLNVSSSNEAGMKFLAENAGKEGVISLPSGLQYKVLRKGSGAFHPTASSPCDCHYAGTLIDGTEFDSSYARGSPTTFAPNQVIKGWTEAMQLMVEGDKWEMYIPSELGYGDRGSPPKIGGGDVLIFTMEIIKIKGDKVPALTCDPQTFEGCNEKETKYAGSTKDWEQSKITKEIGRLQKINSKGGTKDDLKEWINRRINILQKLQSAPEL